jgi:FMN phosphatase YigB (HAD superfamily)
MLQDVEVVLLDVYRSLAFDQEENREPTLENRQLLKLRPPEHMDEGRFNELLIAHSVTLNEPDIEQFQRHLAQLFGGKYTKVSAKKIERLVRKEKLTPYEDTHTTLEYFTEVNKQIRAVGLFSNAWIHSHEAFNKLFGKYLTASTEPGRCPTVPLYSWMSGYAKPHPKAFQYAMQALGGEACNYLVVDDSLANVLTAHKLGMKAILIIRDNNMCPLKIPKGVMVIHNLEPLVAAFKDVDSTRPLLARLVKRLTS